MRSNENFTFFQQKVYNIFFGLLSDETGMWGIVYIGMCILCIIQMLKKYISSAPFVVCLWDFFFIYILDEVSLFKINIRSFVWVGKDHNKLHTWALPDNFFYIKIYFILNIFNIKHVLFYFLPVPSLYKKFNLKNAGLLVI